MSEQSLVTVAGELTRRADQTEDKFIKLSLFEQSARLYRSYADSNPTLAVYLGWSVNYSLVNAALDVGRIDKALLVVGSMQNAGAEIKSVSATAGMWLKHCYISLLARLPFYLPVSRRQFSEIFNGYEQLVWAEEGNRSLILYSLVRAAFGFGEIDQAWQAFEQWEDAGSNRVPAPCFPCMSGAIAGQALNFDPSPRSLGFGEKIKACEMYCKMDWTKKIRVDTELMLPLLRAGRKDEAKECFHAQIQKCERGTLGLDEAALNILYLTEKNHFYRASRIIETYSREAESSRNCLDRAMFYAAAGKFCRSFADENPGQKILLRLPQDFAFEHQNGYDARALGNSLNENALLLAQKLDHRNGNRYFSTRFVPQLIGSEEFD